MQKTKKLISVILAFCMCLAILPSAFAVDFSDVPANHSYYTAISNLAVEGIIDGFPEGTYKPEEVVTRAQFAKIICYALNVGNAVGDGAVDTGFTDVAQDHWAAVNIKMAASMGIINGMGDGTFQPESPILFEQAIKMIVCALGYSLQAENLGGYYHGHMSVATNLGLLKGVVDGGIGQGAQRGTIAKLVDNMLNADTVATDGSRGESIRDSLHKSSTFTGQVTAIYGSTIKANTQNPCGRNQIQVTSGEKSVIFSVDKLSGIDTSDCLGKMVTVHYQEDDDLIHQELSNISVLSNRNTVTTVDLEDIESVSNTAIECVIDDDIETISVYSDADKLYNGAATTDNLTNLIDTTLSGEVTFIDAGNTGSANVVIIKIYRTMIVKSKVANDYKLYDDATSANLVLDVDDITKNITIKKNGNVSSFNNINVGDVVSYASSINGNVIDVLVSNKSVSGTVSNMVTSQHKVTVRTGSSEETYKYSNYFIENYLTPGKVTLEVTTSGKFYIDAFGKLVKVDTSTVASSVKYGYLLGFENIGTATTPQLAVKILDINGSSNPKESFPYLADKVRIDGEPFSNNDMAAIDLKLTASANVFNPGVTLDSNAKYSQVIKYTLNSAGKIDKIYTVNYATDDNNKVHLNNTYYSNTPDNTTKIMCTATGSRLDNTFVINSNTKVLLVPDERYEAGTSEFKGNTGSYFKKNYRYNVQLIDIKDTDNSIAIVLVYGAAATDNNTWYSRKPMIIKEKKAELDTETNEIKNKLVVIDYTGAVKTLTQAENGKSFDLLEVGDIIRTDNDSLVEEYKIDYITQSRSLPEGTTVTMTGVGEHAEDTYTINPGSSVVDVLFRMLYGTANLKSDTTLNVVKGLVTASDVDPAVPFVLDNTLGGETYTINSNTKVILVDSAKIAAEDTERGVTVSVPEEILCFNDLKDDSASKVLVFTAGSIVAKTIYIFK